MCLKNASELRDLFEHWCLHLSVSVPLSFCVCPLVYFVLPFISSSVSHSSHITHKYCNLEALTWWWDKKWKKIEIASDQWCIVCSVYARNVRWIFVEKSIFVACEENRSVRMRNVTAQASIHSYSSINWKRTTNENRKSGEKRINTTGNQPIRNILGQASERNDERHLYTDCRRISTTSAVAVADWWGKSSFHLFFFFYKAIHDYYLFKSRGYSKTIHSTLFRIAFFSSFIVVCSSSAAFLAIFMNILINAYSWTLSWALHAYNFFFNVYSSLFHSDCLIVCRSIRYGYHYQQTIRFEILAVLGWAVRMIFLFLFFRCFYFFFLIFHFSKKLHDGIGLIDNDLDENEEVS